MKKKLIYIWLLICFITACGLLINNDVSLFKSKTTNIEVQQEVQKKEQPESQNDVNEQIPIRQQDTKEYVRNESDNVSNYNIQEETLDEAEKSQKSDKIKKNSGNTGKLDQQQLLEMKESQKGNYYFDSLSDEMKNLYCEINWILQNSLEEETLSSKSTTDIDYAFECVMNDHPEIFYVTGYSYTKHTMGETITKITFSGSYSYSKDDIANIKILIDQYVNDCLNGIDNSADDYTKVKYVYEYLIQTTDYDLDARDNQNICSVFLYGKTVCQGYAKATQYLLNKMGVKTTLVMGSVIQTGEGHAWNLILINGAYYYVDTTWGDAFYNLVNYDNSNSNVKTPSINYDYLCVTTEQLTKTHIISDMIPMPRCISSEANYYVKEGYYFTFLDESKIGTLFQEAYKIGKSYITIKCETQELYKQMEDYLIKEQKIFKFLQNSNTVSYTNSIDQLSFSFWLS